MMSMPLFFFKCQDARMDEVHIAPSLESGKHIPEQDCATESLPSVIEAAHSNGKKKTCESAQVNPVIRPSLNNRYNNSFHSNLDNEPQNVDDVPTGRYRWISRMKWPPLLETMPVYRRSFFFAGKLQLLSDQRDQDEPSTIKVQKVDDVLPGRYLWINDEDGRLISRKCRLKGENLEIRAKINIVGFKAAEYRLPLYMSWISRDYTFRLGRDYALDTRRLVLQLQLWTKRIPCDHRPLSCM
ncbi:hypothetical protein GHT06_021108 [Daphnia sinensis]|uniref:Uncharacterized protein n=1 Tax=Daphnia sinensis TaxID=1820382 RepID=A0AAD5PPM8_9CRUS|nr:hypothetical protein GHT06_021108 [Daphnia sinensis]